MKNIFCLVLCVLTVLLSDICAYAKQGEKETENEIVVDGNEYDAQEFMQRVIECTKRKETITSVVDVYGNLVDFHYDENGYRTEKITQRGKTLYEYDINGNLVKEILPNGETIDYLYMNKEGVTAIYGLKYQETEYSYIIDNDAIVAGLCDMSGQEVCAYQYDVYGFPIHIYEVSNDGFIEHFDNEGDSFVGCVNSIRYTGDCFDAETKMYCIKEGGYYNTQENSVIGNEYYVDMEELFGDRYQALDAAFRAGNLVEGARISSNDVYQLIYAASQYYEQGLRYYTEDYSSYGDSWYSNFSGGKEYYLVARIIYGENTYTSSDSTMETYLKYNRQGIGWEILNRYLEDDYRYKNGRTLFFSDKSSTTAPSFYSVLTKKSAFTSIGGSNAKGYISTANAAYQEAFWVASCMKVCSNFEQWNAVVPRPTGITSQCYNRGTLSSTSAPNSAWKNVIFPGFATDYTGKKNYAEFTYYSSISKFNILFSYSTESLYIDSVYY